MLTFFQNGEYSVEIDGIRRNEWDHSIRDFEDMSVYQTWSWGKVSFGEKRLSHLVVRRDGQPVSMTQVRISTVPFLGRGMASVAWGPLWLRRGSAPDPEILRYTLRFLKAEYAEKRKLFLILKPSITGVLATDVHSILLGEEFSPSSLRGPCHTLVMDISRPLESMMAGMRPEWRRNLMKAMRKGLECESGSGEYLLDELAELYRQMVARKRFTDVADFNFYKGLQRDLDERHKFSILICRHEAIPVAGLICSPLGQTSLMLNGATGDRGLNLFGSYLLWWKAIEHLNGCGCRWLDTCGINRALNPGGYQFKSGVCGNLGRKIEAVEYQYCTNETSETVVRFGQRARKLRADVTELQHIVRR